MGKFKITPDLVDTYRSVKKALADDYTPAERAEKAREALQELRDGSGFERAGRRTGGIEAIEKALNAGVTPEVMGTTLAEIEAFRNGESAKIHGRKLLAECRSGKGFVPELEELLERQKIPPEDIGTDETEMYSLARADQLRFIRLRVSELRNVASGEKYGDPAEIRKDIFDRLRIYKERFEFTLEELGTSKLELYKLVKLGWIANAKMWWKSAQEKAQKGDHHFDDKFRLLREALSNAGIGLGDIGLSEEKLATLVREYNLQVAKNDLTKLRTRNKDSWFVCFEVDGMAWSLELGRGNTDMPGNPEKILEDMKEHLEKAHGSLESIGTTEEEIQELMRNGYIFSATILLAHVRRVLKAQQEIWSRGQKIDEPYSFKRDTGAIRHYLNKAGATFESLSTSEAELQALEA